MLDYASLSALAAVVREGSFERAARALHVTPSAVSQRIRLLEERIGCALVVRGQPCHATETGRRLCQHVDRVRLLEHELNSEVPTLGHDGEARVPLPIAVNADSLATWFAPAVVGFAAAAPVLMEISVDDQDHTSEWLRSGAVLAAVTGTPRPASGCNSQALGAMRYLAAASPEFVERYFRQRCGYQQFVPGPKPGVQPQGRTAIALGATRVPSSRRIAAAHLAVFTGLCLGSGCRNGVGTASAVAD
jgi:LysR family transcriptional regulator (chromosome initiation inhibitor)